MPAGVHQEGDLRRKPTGWIDDWATADRQAQPQERAIGNTVRTLWQSGRTTRGYTGLPSHEIPLPPSHDEGGDARSSTLSLGSGSTQEWVATQSCGGRRVETPWSYTSQLNEGLCDDGGNAAVDLSFQLSSSSGAASMHTRIINPHPGVDCTDNTLGGVSRLRDGGLPHTLREGGGKRNESTSTIGGGAGARERPEWMRLSPASRSGSDAPFGRKRPEDLCQEGADVHKFQNLSGGKESFKLASKDKWSEGFNFVMDRSMYDEMEAMTKGDHMIHPKNLADTGAAGGVQMPADAGAAGDTMATEGGGEAADEEQESTKYSTFSAGSGGGYGKRKNMRQQTFEVVADVMDKHGALMASTMDSPSKRQCSMMLHQCEILESEVECRRRSSVWIFSLSFSPRILLAADPYRPFGGPASISREDLLLAAEQCSSPSRVGLHQRRRRSSLWIFSLSFSPRILLVADPYRSFGGPAPISREDLLLAAEQCSSPSRVGLHQCCRRSSLWIFSLSFSPQIRVAPLEVRRRLVVKFFFSPRRSVRSVHLLIALADTWRGEKHVYARRRPWEEAVKHPREQSGRERGRRHVPKAKRLRSEEASASLPLRRGRSWTAANEEEDDDVFTTEEKAAEDNVAAPQGSTLQRSSDQSGARRLVTPPPEAQQVRAHNTQKAKEVVVDVGREDNEPLESRRQRNVTQGATETPVRILVATRERPPQGGLPLTLSQPRPRSTVAEGGSMKRGGGEGAQQKARVAGGGAIAAAAAGCSGNVGAVARAREEVLVVEPEATRIDNKGESEDEDPLLSQVLRGGNAREVADGARLWVDDKAFWTTGEGRRLYNIIHESQEYFVAIASGMQTPSVPRSVVMPKSSTTLTQIADPAQLQQAIARTTATKNIALRVLHGWVFKSGNRPRGFNIAFQYALESVATDIARVMWYGEEWSNVVSAAVCAHTIDLNMDLPLWFAGAIIEDRPEDDDMAAHQEATVICIAHAFRAAVQMGGIVHGGFVLH
ncbi:hypothetical protein CBR_g38710 [Chara braunii]|uniref:Uncharacterized protein n=1 Tax=Chara braunii TaxID=69332 RepID=A0A388LQA0_CHABU|nr:hypothetical protein CBR_g38710 [Chara braunii]|eukprot:GBG84425.1 hypothetical protein CBR_g38710 [Chara braunii]